jgi:phosphoribosylformimino-5-aminoimidazole carboxamide ribotide isomerase
VIHTDNSRDGMLHGANIAGSLGLARAGSRPPAGRLPFQVIVSGGVASLEDIRQVKAAEAEGLEGIIIGKALYTGAVELSTALQIAHSQIGL